MEGMFRAWKDRRRVSVWPEREGEGCVGNTLLLCVEMRFALSFVVIRFCSLEASIETISETGIPTMSRWTSGSIIGIGVGNGDICG